VVAGHEDTVERLDRALWTFRDDSFVPHGRARADAEKHPVLLSTEAVPTNGAKVAVLLDGSDADASLFERVMVVFDGQDETARAKARQQFKAATDAGAPARYFQQDKSGWVERTPAKKDA